MALDFAVQDLASQDLATPDLVATPDLSQVDQRLQATFEVDRTSNFPTLPDSVRMDLSNSSLFSDSAGLSRFLYGLEADLAEAQRRGLSGGDFGEQADLVAPGLPQWEARGNLLSGVVSGEIAPSSDLSAEFRSPTDGWQDVRRAAAGMLGKQSPGVLSADAPTAWKREAFQRGLLNEEEVSGPWSPVRYKQVNYEMMSQQLGEVFSGETSPLAIPTRSDTPGEGMVDLFDKWLSPSGLISTAVAMDFIPDLGAVGRETSQWGDKWRKWWKNPTSVRDFTDAVTGPVDDILFPVLNTALLFSGVGQVWTFARVGGAGFRSLSALKAADSAVDAVRLMDQGVGLAKSGTFAGRMFGGAGFADDAARISAVMQRPGLLSEKAAKSSFQALKSTASAMDKWRSYHSVQTAKLATRNGMRLGLAGNVEEFLLPDREGGLGFVGRGAGSSDALQAARDFRYSSGPLSALSFFGEFPLQPSRLFMPGTVKGVGSTLSGATKRASEGFDLTRDLSETTAYTLGRATGETTAKLQEVARDRALTGMMSRWIETTMDDDALRIYRGLSPEDRSLAAANFMNRPSELEEFGRTLRTGSIREREALEERGGRIMLWMTGTAGINNSARRLIEETGARADDTTAFFRARNHIISSLRPSQAARLDITPERFAEIESRIAEGGWAAVEARGDMVALRADLEVFAEEQLGYNWMDVRHGDEAVAGLHGDKDFLARRDAEVQDWVSDFLNPEKREEAFSRVKVSTEEWEARRTGAWNAVLAELELETVPVFLDEVRLANPEAFDSWDDFETAVQMVDNADLSRADLAFRSVDEAAGLVPAGRLEDMEQLMAPYSFDEGKFATTTAFGEGLSDELRKLKVSPDSLPDSLAMGYKGMVEKMHSSKLTVARRATPVKQDVDNTIRVLQRLRKMRQTITETPEDLIGKSRSLRDSFEDWYQSFNPNVEGAFDDLSDKSLMTYLRESDVVDGVFPEGAESTQLHKRWAQMVQWMSTSGGDLDNPLEWIREMESDLMSAPLVQKLFPGRRFEDLEELLTELGRKRTTVAAEVTFTPEMVRRGGKLTYADGNAQRLAQMEASLASRGYKLVYGVNFLGLEDLVGLKSPFAEVTQMSMNRQALGLAASKVSEGTKMKMRYSRLRSSLPEYLARSTGRSWKEYEVDSLIDRMTDWTVRMREHADQTVDANLGAGLTSKAVGRAQQALTPRQIFDTNMTEKRLMAWLDVDRETAMGIRGALTDARKLGVEFNGFNELEYTLRAKPWIRSILGMYDASPGAPAARRLSLAQKAYLGDGPPVGFWDEFRLAKRAGVTLAGAAVGGAVSERAGGDWLEGAAGGALLGASPGAVGGAARQLRRIAPEAQKWQEAAGKVAQWGDFNPFSFRNSTRALIGGGVASTLNAEMEGDNPILAVGAGVAAAALTPGLMRSGAAAYDAAQPYIMKATNGALGGREYSRLTEWGVGMRDFLRFSLNPWFDAQRYSEAITMGATRDFDGFRLPLNYSPSNTRRMWNANKLDRGKIKEVLGHPVKNLSGDVLETEMGTVLRDLTGGRVDPDLMEATSKRFTDEGILGFSNHRWMTSAFTHLVSQGMDPVKAAAGVQDLYSYGKAGRSAVELSANFVFFPFSFMKKFTKQVGRFLTDDMSRALVMHDSLKTYELLDEHYDLQSKMEAHLPILRQLRTLNPLAYGISPGVLGGINRPALDLMYAAPVVGEAVQDVANLFIPQAVRLESPEDHATITDLMMRAVPAVGQARRLVDDVKGQSHVVSSGVSRGTWVSRQVEVDRGMEELQRVRSDFEVEAGDRGWTLAQVMRSRSGSSTATGLMKREMKRRYKAAETEVADRFPALSDARSDWLARRIEKDNELRGITDRPTPVGLSVAEQGVWAFKPIVDEFKASMKEKGLGDSDEDFYPEEELRRMRAVAVGIAYENPGFERFYQMYWADLLGNIEMDINPYG